MNDAFPNLERLSLPDQQHCPLTPANSLGIRSSFPSPKIKGEFLKGPIPLDWLGRAAKLSGKASLSVGLALWFEAGRRRSHQVTLTTAICDRFSINRKSKYRGLELLEQAGLISVVRRPRRNPLVAILLQPDGNLADQIAGNVSRAETISEINLHHMHQKGETYVRYHFNNADQTNHLGRVGGA